MDAERRSRHRTLSGLILSVLALGFVGLVALNNNTPTQALRLLVPTTPAPFLYPPFLGEATRASSVFDHTEPKYLEGQNAIHRYRLTTFNGTVVACSTHTPSPPATPPPPVVDSNCPINYDGHNGIDYVVRYQPIVAAASVSAVERAGWRLPTNRGFSYGLYTVVSHPNGYLTLYGHLSAIAVEVCPSCPFPQGHVLGISGRWY